MKHILRTIVASGAALSLTACASVFEMDRERAQGSLSECEELGAAVNPGLEAGGYVLKMSLERIGDNSVTGTVTEVLEARDEKVCDRFNDRGFAKPLQIHSNYNKKGTWSTDRVQVCKVTEGGQTDAFLDARNQVEELVRLQPGLEVTITGHKRKSYVSTDDYGNAEYEKRDVCLGVQIPLR